LKSPGFKDIIPREFVEKSNAVWEKHLAFVFNLIHLFFSLFRLFFDPEDGGDMFLRNVG
jgi:hypothetical protein